MAGVAQLEQFDEELYKVGGGEGHWVGCRMCVAVGGRGVYECAQGQVFVKGKRELRETFVGERDIGGSCSAAGTSPSPAP